MADALIVAFGIAAVLLALGGAATRTGRWYAALRKPALQPPRWAFGPAWTVILALAAWAAAIAWQAAADPAQHARVIALFGANALCHALWSPLFFRARRPDWALLAIGALLASLVALVVGLWPISIRASLLVVPYLAWVGFATWLNRAIVQLNRPFA